MSSGKPTKSVAKFLRRILGVSSKSGIRGEIDCGDVQELARTDNWDAALQCARVDSTKRLDFLAFDVEQSAEQDSGLNTLNKAKMLLAGLYSFKYLVIMVLVSLLVIWFVYYLGVHVKSRLEEHRELFDIRALSRKYNEWQQRVFVCLRCLKLLPQQQEASVEVPTEEGDDSEELVDSEAAGDQDPRDEAAAEEADNEADSGDEDK